MTQMTAKPKFALAIFCCALFGAAHAATPVPPETRLVAAANAAAPTQLSFTIATTQDLVVTLTDLALPGPLVSAGIVVTQGDAIAGSAQMAAPAATATFALAAASGNYTLYVFGVPNASYSIGTFIACVAPKASPSNCIQSASLSGNITAQGTGNDPTVSTLSTDLVVAAAGSYTFTFSDLTFPVALKTAPSLALFQGSSPIGTGFASGTAFTLSPGTYRLLAIAQADATVKAGLYGITITGPAGTTPLFDNAVPVGLINPAGEFSNPTAQSLTLKVSDYGFPGPLASASALLTGGGTALGTASAAGGAMVFAAPARTLDLWTYGSAGAGAGSFSADVAGATDLYTAAEGVSSGATYAYAFVWNVQTAGAFQASAADLQFPTQLNGLSFAVAQNGVILQQSAAPASLNFNASAGPVVLLASAQAPTTGGASGNAGLFDVNVQTTGASAQLVYDKTQSVSSTPALFDSQSLALGVSGAFTAALTDLKFPAQFSTLALVVSRGTEILGKIYGGGPFSFPGTPGNYQLTFVATPSTTQQFGLYGVSVVSTPPVVSLTSSVSTAVTGAAVTLTWTAANATSCAASGGSWTGSKAANGGTEAVSLTATTTYTLSCTGDGGTVAQSVAVTATAPAKSGGGGALDLGILGFGAVLLGMRARKRAVT